jgi:hypothetical protein
MLGKNGLFVNVLEGMNGHNGEEVYLWRLVIDQSLRDAISSNTSAAKRAMDWVSAPPGRTSLVSEAWEDENTGETKYLHYEVDLNEEFSEVCEMANLDPDFVRTTWLRTYNKIKAEDAARRKKPK